jgi:Protein of unknown function (DUF4012)
MPKKKRYNVIPQMFDVKPADMAGDLGVEKLKRFSRTINIKKEKNIRSEIIKDDNFWSSGVVVREKTKTTRNKNFSNKRAVNFSGKVNIIQFNQNVGSREKWPSYVRVKRKSVIKKSFPENYYNYKGEKNETRRKEDWLQAMWEEKQNREFARRSEFDKTFFAPTELANERNEKNERLKERKDIIRKALSLKKLFLKRSDLLKKKKQLLNQKNILSENQILLEEENKKLQNKIFLLEREALLARKKTSSSKSSLRGIKETHGKLFPEKEKDEKNILPNLNILGLKPVWGFATISLLLVVSFFTIRFISYGWQIKGDVLNNSKTAIGYLAQAKDDMNDKDFTTALSNIENAEEEFKSANEDLDKLGGDLLNVFSKIPGLSKISSGKKMLEAGEYISLAAKNLGEAAQLFSQVENPLSEEKDGSKKSFGDTLLKINENILEAQGSLKVASEKFDQAKEDDLPVEYRDKFVQGKGVLRNVVALLDGFDKNYQIFWEILGYNGPRKYLFLFQNNQEMRATGGFVGSYGILNINEGEIKSLLIEGIYNPDGQLWEKVVPPKPIQKVSATWSTHDANWFPHFPTSAEKIAWFYEKTGGPTVDGIITLTPTVMQKLLEVTGPIEMPEYETTVDKDNFIEKTQYEVEIDYDKELNKPKKFIADLAPKILNEVFSSKELGQFSKTMNIFSEAMKEKHILIYSFDYNIQKFVSELGWAGEILQTEKDYLMVVNSNINGFKTDGVVDESIEHQAEIQPDGSIINTVKIKRKHNGGDTGFEWWDKVNSDYMRVYVPKGSELLEVKGQTREFNSAPLDYDQLKFRRDPQVEQEENSMKIDEDSGTRVYEEQNKTVFANWVYVSPKETVEIEYRYRLPFKVDLNKNTDKVDSYSLLAQKQSGSVGSEFSSEIKLAENMKLIWRYPETIDQKDSSIIYKQKLSQDKFLGLVLQDKSFNEN